MKKGEEPHICCFCWSEVSAHAPRNVWFPLEVVNLANLAHNEHMQEYWAQWRYDPSRVCAL
jgi:hypothetical protein